MWVDLAGELAAESAPKRSTTNPETRTLAMSPLLAYAVWLLVPPDVGLKVVSETAEVFSFLGILTTDLGVFARGTLHVESPLRYGVGYLDSGRPLSGVSTGATSYGISLSRPESLAPALQRAVDRSLFPRRSTANYPSR